MVRKNKVESKESKFTVHVNPNYQNKASESNSVNNEEEARQVGYQEYYEIAFDRFLKKVNNAKCNEDIADMIANLITMQRVISNMIRLQDAKIKQEGKSEFSVIDMLSNIVEDRSALENELPEGDFDWMEYALTALLVQ